MDKPIKREYANTLDTDYTYDPKNFRLKTIKTSNLQDLSYNYDPVGNVIDINDTSNNNQSF